VLYRETVRRQQTNNAVVQSVCSVTEHRMCSAELHSVNTRAQVGPYCRSVELWVRGLFGAVDRTKWQHSFVTDGAVGIRVCSVSKLLTLYVCVCLSTFRCCRLLYDARSPAAITVYRVAVQCANCGGCCEARLGNCTVAQLHNCTAATTQQCNQQIAVFPSGAP
jgi:hypothetical protein